MGSCASSRFRQKSYENLRFMAKTEYIYLLQEKEFGSCNDTNTCFHPSTKIKLQNGNIAEIQNLNLGDVLENGSIVEVVMKIGNFSNETYYKFEKKGVDNEDIYVTGTHIVLDDDNKYIYVKDHPLAIIQPEKEAKWFSSLITSNHLIKIGSQIFWDWEDDEITKYIIISIFYFHIFYNL